MADSEDHRERPDGEPSTGSSASGRRQIGRFRRNLLKAIATGGSTLLAGCGQDRSGTPTTSGDGRARTDDPSGNPETRVYDQTFRAPIADDPSKTTFLSRHGLRPASLYGWDRASIPLQRFIWETGVWPDGLWVGKGDIHYTWIEAPIKISPTEITISIRDDARWSDGHQVTGKDIATIPISQSLRKFFPPYYAQTGRNEPTDIYTAFDEFELGDRSVTYRSSAGHFDTFWDIHIQKRLGTFFGPHLLPTHVAPYDAYADAVIETATKAQRGTLDPWAKGSDAPHKRNLIENHLRDIRWAKKFSKAENVLSTGAWDLVSMRGAREFVFERNDYHRNADDLNFDRFVLEYTPSNSFASRQHAALAAGRLDYGSAVTPQSVVEAFPDHITQLKAPGGLYSGNELEIRFTHQGMGKRPVRAAIMYALDHATIAKNISQVAARPVNTPGGDCWDATEWASQDWLETNLITYETDRERATSLMREAGYTREDGRWIGPEGSPLELTIATNRTTPRWEPTVASQLSEFGIQTAVRSFSDSTFSIRHSEFPLWTDGTATMTNTAPLVLNIWYSALVEPQKYGIFPDRQFASGDFSILGVPVPRTEERWRDFTIEAPPVGQPNGPLKQYHPGVLTLSYTTNPPKAEFRRRVKTGMWLANWFLPILPITKKLQQHFIDDVHWQWPRDSPSWKHFTGEGFRSRGGFFAPGTVRANPSNLQ